MRREPVPFIGPKYVETIPSRRGSQDDTEKEWISVRLIAVLRKKERVLSPVC